MFYDNISLRKGGKFYLCWVADAWPLRFAKITQRQLLATNIPQICENLLEGMISESGRPSKRFSLRLSCQLLHGLARIYQRKADLVIAELCMMDAKIMKKIHSMYGNETDLVQRRQPRELPRLQIQEVGEENLEQRFQNTSFMVAREQDITLKEPTLPENRLLLDDGFGEMHPDQPLLMVVDRSAEIMLGKETSALQHSVLDLPQDFSTDKSRLALHDTAQMERISEHDTSLFKKGEKSMGLDAEREIPDISVIPPLEISDPQPRNGGIEKVGEELKKEVNKSQEMVLEALEEEPLRKRKMKNKLIIDKRKTLRASYLRSRIGNNDLEQRTEEALLRKSPQKMDKVMDVTSKTFPEQSVRESLIQEVPVPNISGGNNLELSTLAQEAIEMADLPTQIIGTAQAEKRTSEFERSPKRCRWDYVFRKRESALLDLEANKDNLPDAENVQQLLVTSDIEPRQNQSDEERLMSLLQEAGLDMPEKSKDTPITVRRGRGSDSSETPLGSLDRTKVSLGDTDDTTDTQRFLRDEWGSRGTMRKIYRCVLNGVSPITVRELVDRGPVITGHQRIVAAQCFYSLLKLKQHGFITFIKDDVTLEIKDILLGEKFT